MSAASRPAIEYEAFQVETGGQDVLVTWFPPRDVPEGQRDVFLPLHHRALIAAGLLNE